MIVSASDTEEIPYMKYRFYKMYNLDTSEFGTFTMKFIMKRTLIAIGYLMPYALFTHIYFKSSLLFLLTIPLMVHLLSIRVRSVNLVAMLIFFTAALMFPCPSNMICSFLTAVSYTIFFFQKQFYILPFERILIIRWLKTSVKPLLLAGLYTSVLTFAMVSHKSLHNLYLIMCKIMLALMSLHVCILVLICAFSMNLPEVSPSLLAPMLKSRSSIARYLALCDLNLRCMSPCASHRRELWVLNPFSRWSEILDELLSPLEQRLNDFENNPQAMRDEFIQEAAKVKISPEAFIITIISSFVVSSYTDDSLGIVQRTLSKILKIFLELSAFTTSACSQNPIHISLKTGLFRITSTFKDTLENIGLSDREMKSIRIYQGIYK